MAALVLLELRLTTNPPNGAWPPVKLMAKTPELFAPMLMDDDEKTIVGEPTVAVPIPETPMELLFQLVMVPVIVEVPIDWP